MKTAVEFSVDGAIGYITLNRPEAGNAINLKLAQDFMKAVSNCEHDSAIRCVILRGQGRLFCAGGDLQAFKVYQDRLPEYLADLAGILHLAMSRLMRMEKPVITLINGAAAGAGFGIAMAGDIVLAAKSARFTVGYGAIGLSPDAGLTWLLPRLVGMRKTQQIIMMNESISADQAEALGLVTQTVDDEELASAGQQLAMNLSNSAVAAIGRTRQLLLETYNTGLETHLEREARLVAIGGSGSEVAEGITAFSEKRKPHFR